MGGGAKFGMTELYTGSIGPIVGTLESVLIIEVSARFSGVSARRGSTLVPCLEQKRYRLFTRPFLPDQLHHQIKWRRESGRLHQYSHQHTSLNYLAPTGIIKAVIIYST